MLLGSSVSTETQSCLDELPPSALLVNLRQTIVGAARPQRQLMIALCFWNLRRFAEATEATGQCEVSSLKCHFFWTASILKHRFYVKLRHIMELKQNSHKVFKISWRF